MTKFDYIIVGAGVAGLMLADAMGKDKFFSDKTILLLDKDQKNKNDRTWCYWEKGQGKFDSIVHKSWERIYFAGQEFSKRCPITPYTYKMIRGIDFYSTYLKRISQYQNITFKIAAVDQIKEGERGAVVVTENNSYETPQVFNSIFSYAMATHQDKYPVLQQHFVGWFVQTEKPIFDTDTVTYMDFSIPQKENTRFMYVLPFSETKALVEYTLFSNELLPTEAYEEAIDNYLQKDLQCGDYKILEKEQGSIPMTCYDFSEHNTAHVFHIGTAGGWAKPSTGYTFMGTARKIPLLIDLLKAKKELTALTSKNKFWFYDVLFLDVLFSNNAKGHQIFESLFKKRKLGLIFKFLDEESSLIEDIKYISSCPKTPFVMALLKRFF